MGMRDREVFRWKQRGREHQRDKRASEGETENAPET